MLDFKSLDNADVFIALFNFVTSVANVIWSLQVRASKNDSDIIRELKESNKDKEDLLIDLDKDKERWKTQYHSLLNKFKHLEGKLLTYEKLKVQGVEASHTANTITT